MITYPYPADVMTFVYEDIRLGRSSRIKPYMNGMATYLSLYPVWGKVVLF
jgi:hypothetical protein